MVFVSPNEEDEDVFCMYEVAWYLTLVVAIINNVGRLDMQCFIFIVHFS